MTFMLKSRLILGMVIICGIYTHKKKSLLNDFLDPSSGDKEMIDVVLLENHVITSIRALVPLALYFFKILFDFLLVLLKNISREKTKDKETLFYYFLFLK